jgi:hypothetical protein
LSPLVYLSDTRNIRDIVQSESAALFIDELIRCASDVVSLADLKTLSQQVSGFANYFSPGPICGQDTAP